MKIKRYNNFLLESNNIHKILSNEEMHSYFQPLIDESKKFEIDNMYSDKFIKRGNCIYIDFDMKSLSEEIVIKELNHIVDNIRMDYKDLYIYYNFRKSIGSLAVYISEMENVNNVVSLLDVISI